MGKPKHNLIIHIHLVKKKSTKNLKIKNKNCNAAGEY